MKSIKQIREQYDLITEKEEKESNKLNTLVRAGLYDAKKLPALKKALDKTPDKMSGQEKRMLISLLDSLIDQVVSDDQVYRKVRQNVHMKEEKKDTYSKYDDRFKKGWPTDKEMPSVLILKRKAIRVYPDDQKVALYYSQALDKYVTIPFNDIQVGINEEQLDENALKLIGTVGAAALKYGAKYADDAVKAGKNVANSKTVRSVGAGIASGYKKAKDFGKNILNKYKNKKRRPDIDIELGGGNNNQSNGGGSSGGSSNNDRSPTPTYNFSGKIQGKSSWDSRSTSDAAQRRRDQTLNRKAMMSENVIDTVKNMVDNNIAESTIRFDEQEIMINNTVAKKLVGVYEAMNKTNKKKMETMLNESATSFNKVLTFAVRQ